MEKLENVPKKVELLPEPVASQFVCPSLVNDSVGDSDSPKNKTVEVDNVDIQEVPVYLHTI